jgi:teichoic acid transport system ATP-binding protein
MIIGRNGSFKSKMLKMITEVVFPTNGKITVNGRVSALLELTTGFDPEFTGRENIYLKGQLMGLSDKEISKLEPTIIDFAELGDYIDQPVRTYSSGMTARLGFSINANIEPEILVIDEALSVGDMKFREKCQEKIDEIVEKEHVTVLYVTHSPSSAEDFCERGLVLNQGKLVFDGEYDDAVEAYDEILDR